MNSKKILVLLFLTLFSFLAAAQVSSLDYKTENLYKYFGIAKITDAKNEKEFVVNEFLYNYPNTNSYYTFGDKPVHNSELEFPLIEVFTDETPVIIDFQNVPLKFEITAKLVKEVSPDFPKELLTIKVNKNNNFCGEDDLLFVPIKDSKNFSDTQTFSLPECGISFKVKHKVYDKKAYYQQIPDKSLKLYFSNFEITKTRKEKEETRQFDKVYFDVGMQTFNSLLLNDFENEVPVKKPVFFRYLTASGVPFAVLTRNSSFIVKAILELHPDLKFPFTATKPVSFNFLGTGKYAINAKRASYKADGFFNFVVKKDGETCGFQDKVFVKNPVTLEFPSCNMSFKAMFGRQGPKLVNVTTDNGKILTLDKSLGLRATSVVIYDISLPTKEVLNVLNATKKSEEAVSDQNSAKPEAFQTIDRILYSLNKLKKEKANTGIPLKINAEITKSVSSIEQEAKKMQRFAETYSRLGKVDDSNSQETDSAIQAIDSSLNLAQKQLELLREVEKNISPFTKQNGNAGGIVSNIEALKAEIKRFLNLVEQERNRLAKTRIKQVAQEITETVADEGLTVPLTDLDSEIEKMQGFAEQVKQKSQQEDRDVAQEADRMLNLVQNFTKKAKSEPKPVESPELEVEIKKMLEKTKTFEEKLKAVKEQKNKELLGEVNKLKRSQRKIKAILENGKNNFLEEEINRFKLLAKKNSKEIDLEEVRQAVESAEQAVKDTGKKDLIAEVEKLKRLANTTRIQFEEPKPQKPSVLSVAVTDHSPDGVERTRKFGLSDEKELMPLTGTIEEEAMPVFFSKTNKGEIIFDFGSDLPKYVLENEQITSVIEGSKVKEVFRLYVEGKYCSSQVLGLETGESPASQKIDFSGCGLSLDVSHAPYTPTEILELSNSVSGNLSGNNPILEINLEKEEKIAGLIDSLYLRFSNVVFHRPRLLQQSFFSTVLTLSPDMQKYNEFKENPKSLPLNVLPSTMRYEGKIKLDTDTTIENRSLLFEFSNARTFKLTIARQNNSFSVSLESQRGVCEKQNISVPGKSIDYSLFPVESGYKTDWVKVTMPQCGAQFFLQLLPESTDSGLSKDTPDIYVAGFGLTTKEMLETLKETATKSTSLKVKPEKVRFVELNSNLSTGVEGLKIVRKSFPFTTTGKNSVLAITKERKIVYVYAFNSEKNEVSLYKPLQDKKINNYNDYKELLQDLKSGGFTLVTQNVTTSDIAKKLATTGYFDKKMNEEIEKIKNAALKELKTEDTAASKEVVNSLSELEVTSSLASKAAEQALSKNISDKKSCSEVIALTNVVKQSTETIQNEAQAIKTQAFSQQWLEAKKMIHLADYKLSKLKEISEVDLALEINRLLEKAKNFRLTQEESRVLKQQELENEIQKIKRAAENLAKQVETKDSQLNETQTSVKSIEQSVQKAGEIVEGVQDKELTDKLKGLLEKAKQFVERFFSAKKEDEKSKDIQAEADRLNRIAEEVLNKTNTGSNTALKEEVEKLKRITESIKNKAVESTAQVLEKKTEKIDSSLQGEIDKMLRLSENLKRKVTQKEKPKEQAPSDQQVSVRTVPEFEGEIEKMLNIAKNLKNKVSPVLPTTKASLEEEIKQLIRKTEEVQSKLQEKQVEQERALQEEVKQMLRKQLIKENMDVLLDRIESTPKEQKSAIEKELQKKLDEQKRQILLADAKIIQNTQTVKEISNLNEQEKQELQLEIDRFIRLQENKTQKVVEEIKLDLKTAIKKIKDLLGSAKEKISSAEQDLKQAIDLLDELSDQVGEKNIQETKQKISEVIQKIESTEFTANLNPGIPGLAENRVETARFLSGLAITESDLPDALAVTGISEEEAKEQAQQKIKYNTEAENLEVLSKEVNKLLSIAQNNSKKTESEEKIIATTEKILNETETMPAQEKTLFKQEINRLLNLAQEKGSQPKREAEKTAQRLIDTVDRQLQRIKEQANSIKTVKDSLETIGTEKTKLENALNQLEEKRFNCTEMSDEIKLMLNKAKNVLNSSEKTEKAIIKVKTSPSGDLVGFFANESALRGIIFVEQETGKDIVSNALPAYFSDKMQSCSLTGKKAVTETGIDKLNYSWSFSGINSSTCLSNGKGKFCDATQFTIFLLKRMSLFSSYLKPYLSGAQSFTPLEDAVQSTYTKLKVYTSSQDNSYNELFVGSEGKLIEPLNPAHCSVDYSIIKNSLLEYTSLNQFPETNIEELTKRVQKCYGQNYSADNVMVFIKDSEDKIYNRYGSNTNKNSNDFQSMLLKQAMPLTVLPDSFAPYKYVAPVKNFVSVYSLLSELFGSNNYLKDNTLYVTGIIKGQTMSEQQKNALQKQAVPSQSESMPPVTLTEMQVLLIKDNYSDSFKNAFTNRFSTELAFYNADPTVSGLYDIKKWSFEPTQIESGLYTVTLKAFLSTENGKLNVSDIVVSFERDKKLAKMGKFYSFNPLLEIPFDGQPGVDIQTKNKDFGVSITSNPEILSGSFLVSSFSQEDFLELPASIPITGLTGLVNLSIKETNKPTKNFLTISKKLSDNNYNNNYIYNIEYAKTVPAILNLKTGKQFETNNFYYGLMQNNDFFKGEDYGLLEGEVFVAWYAKNGFEKDGLEVGAVNKCTGWNDPKDVFLLEQKTGEYYAQLYVPESVAFGVACTQQPVKIKLFQFTGEIKDDAISANPGQYMDGSPSATLLGKTSNEKNPSLQFYIDEIKAGRACIQLEKTIDPVYHPFDLLGKPKTLSSVLQMSWNPKWFENKEVFRKEKERRAIQKLKGNVAPILRGG